MSHLFFFLQYLIPCRSPVQRYLLCLQICCGGFLRELSPAGPKIWDQVNTVGLELRQITTEVSLRRNCISLGIIRLIQLRIGSVKVKRASMQLKIVCKS